VDTPAPPAVVEPLAGAVPAPAPTIEAPTYLNLDLRILSPGDNGAGDQPVSAPGLNGNTGASPGVPEDWTWNWNWDMGGCDGGSGLSTAGWTWNWDWGCGDAPGGMPGADEGVPNVLEMVTDALREAPMDLESPDFGFSMPGVDEPAGGPQAELAGSGGGAPSGSGRRASGSHSSGGAFAAPLELATPAQPSGAAVLPASLRRIERAADSSRSDDRATGDGRGSRDPFPFPAPLAAHSSGGTGAGGGGGALLLLVAALVGALALIPPPPGGRVAAWHRRLRSLLSASRLERPG
jgi:hypothetical protein